MAEVLENRLVFPANHREMVAVNRTAFETARTAELEINTLKERVRKASVITEITYALLNSWKDRDPGKYSLSVSFLDSAGRRVMAEEYLIDAGCKRLIIPLNEVVTRECTKCGQSHPLLEWYRQTEDSPCGDTWLKRFILLCPQPEGLPEIIEIDRQESDSRF